MAASFSDRLVTAFAIVVIVVAIVAVVVTRDWSSSASSTPSGSPPPSTSAVEASAPTAAAADPTSKRGVLPAWTQGTVMILLMRAPSGQWLAQHDVTHGPGAGMRAVKEGRPNNFDPILGAISGDVLTFPDGSTAVAESGSIRREGSNADDPTDDSLVLDDETSTVTYSFNGGNMRWHITRTNMEVKSGKHRTYKLNVSARRSTTGMQLQVAFIPPGEPLPKLE